MPSTLNSWDLHSTDLPSRGPYMNEEELEVLAVGTCSGQDKLGVELGSVALLGSGLLDRLQDAHPKGRIYHDNTVYTYREAYEPALVAASEQWSSSNSDSCHSAISNTKRPFESSYACERLSDQVYRNVKRGTTALTVGGDHSISIGTIAGSARACRRRFGQSPAVIWVDAHASLNTPETSNSGNINGMAASFLSGLVKPFDGEPFSWLDDMISKDGPSVDLSKLVYIGLRDIEPAEQALLKEHNVKVFTMKDIQFIGIRSVMEEALSHIGRDTPIHLSFDLDAIDPRYAPATASPVEGGLTLDQATYICSQVRDTRNMVAMDLVELNPEVDDGSEAAMARAYETIEAALSVVESAFGAR